MPVRTDLPSLKRCWHCKTVKAISDFGSNKANPKGINKVCRPCAVKLALKWSKTPKGRAYHNESARRRRTLPEVKEYQRQFYKKWRIENAESKRAYDKQYHIAHREEMKEYRMANREHVKNVQRRHALRKFYGMTPETYQEMLVAQRGRCAICLREENSRHMGVDHDHASGRVRGLLCAGCNLKLGWYEKYRGAVTQYLSVPPAVAFGFPAVAEALKDARTPSPEA